MGSRAKKQGHGESRPSKSRLTAVADEIRLDDWEERGKLNISVMTGFGGGGGGHHVRKGRSGRGERQSGDRDSGEVGFLRNGRWRVRRLAEGFEIDSGRDRGRTGRKVRGGGGGGEGRRLEGEVNRRWGWAAMKRNARRDGTN